MNALTGTAALTRLALRRDRITLPVWVLGLAGFTAGITALSANGLRTTADLVQETALMANSPGMRLIGLASGASTGGYTMIRGYLTLAVLAALMSTFAVVRHTRQSEETGRAELVGAAVTGRHAGLAAALIVTAGANLVLAVLLGLAMFVTGQPVAGSFTAGAAVGAVGLAFAGVAAVTVGRPRWVAGYAVNAVLGATALMLAFATGMGLAVGAVLGDPAGQVRVLTGASLVQLPGILVLGGVVIAAVGLLPRFAGTVSWALLMAGILLGPLFGPTFRLPQWAQDLSPFTHVPKAPAVPVTAAPVLALTVVVVAFTVTGLVSLRRRNLALPT